MQSPLQESIEQVDGELEVARAPLIRKIVSVLSNEIIEEMRIFIKSNLYGVPDAEKEIALYDYKDVLLDSMELKFKINLKDELKKLFPLVHPSLIKDPSKRQV